MEKHKNRKTPCTPSKKSKSNTKKKETPKKPQDKPTQITGNICNYCKLKVDDDMTFEGHYIMECTKIPKVDRDRYIKGYKDRIEHAEMMANAQEEIEEEARSKNIENMKEKRENRERERQERIEQRHRNPTDGNMFTKTFDDMFNLIHQLAHEKGSSNMRPSKKDDPFNIPFFSHQGEISKRKPSNVDDDVISVDLNERMNRRKNRPPATTIETFTEEHENGGKTVTNNINITGNPKTVLEELDKINIENKDQIKEIIKNIDYEALLKAQSMDYMHKLMRDSMAEVLYDPKNNVFNTMIYVHQKGVKTPDEDPIIFEFIIRLAEFLAEKTATNFKECFREYNRKILSDPYEFLTYIDEGIEEEFNNDFKLFVDSSVDKIEEVILDSLVNIIYPVYSSKKREKEEKEGKRKKKTGRNKDLDLEKIFGDISDTQLKPEDILKTNITNQK